MGAARDHVIKYPRTAQVFGSKVKDDGKHPGREESEAFITDPSLVVEEKLDCRCEGNLPRFFFAGHSGARSGAEQHRRSAAKLAQNCGKTGGK